MSALVPGIHAAEAAVERAVTAAERSLARRLGSGGVRVARAALTTLWIIAVLGYFVFGISVLVARYYLLPRIDEWRPRIEASAGAALQAPVTIGAIKADWDGLHPRLALSDVVLQDHEGGTALALPQVTVVLSWASLIAWRPLMDSLTIFAPELEVRRLPDRRFTVAGILIDPQAAPDDATMLDWVLAQRSISVRGARVHFVDEAAAERLEFSDVSVLLTRGLTGHRFSLQVRPPAELAGPIDLRGEFSHPWTAPSNRMASWRGRVFAQFSYADLAHLDALTHLVPAPAHLESAHGALRTWIDFDAMQITRLRADVALDEVSAQLRPDLQPLLLDHLEGRITQSLSRARDSESNEVALSGLRMDGPDDFHLPATDLLFAVRRNLRAGQAPPPENWRFEANRLVLDDWSRLAAQVPLPAEWLALVARTAARGTLEDVRATWDGPATPPRAYSLRARFSGLGFSLGGAGAAPATVASNASNASNASSVPSAPTTPTAPVAPSAGAAGAVKAATVTAPEDGPYTFENLSGEVDVSQGSGALHVDAHDARLRIPPVFNDTLLAFDTLAARARWSSDGGVGISVIVDAVSAANADLDVSAAGSWRSNGTTPPTLELNGRMARARMEKLARYLPRVMAAPARAWIQTGLLAGTLSNGSFMLRGDPKRFPFADPKSGDFRASAQIADGKIDVAPTPTPTASAPSEAGGTPAKEGSPSSAIPTSTPSPTSAPATPPKPLWPLLTNIDADINFERNLITVNARHARSYAYDLDDFTVRLPHIDRPDQHLLIDGQGAGALPELLKFIVASPLNKMTGGWMGGATARGPSRLRVKLDIPLGHVVDSVIDGAVSFRDDELVVRPDLAPFSGVNGEVEFNQRGVRLPQLTAQFLGGDIRISGDTKADGTIILQATGTATPQGARRQVEPPILRNLVDHMHGLFHYGATLAIARGATALQIDSDLVGLTAELPDPLHKFAAEARPLRIAIEPLPGTVPTRDMVRVTLAAAGANEGAAAAPIVAAELHRVASPADARPAGAADGRPEAMRIERGAIGIGAAANVPDSGLLMLVEEPEVDVDRWKALLWPPELADAPSTGSDAGGDDPLDQIVVRTPALRIDEKTLSNLSLSARRDANAEWAGNLESDQAVGAVAWIAASPAGPGHITARLAKLSIADDHGADDHGAGTRAPGAAPADAPAGAASAQSAAQDPCKTTAAPPTELPGLDIVAEQFEMGRRKLGRLEVLTQNSAGTHPEAWNLEKFSLSSPSGALTGTGTWQRTGASGPRRMAVKFEQSYANAGDLLVRYGFPGIIRNGTGKLEGELSWNGSPFSVDCPSLDGKLHVSVDKGQFLKADAGAGRLLGVLSLESLLHRLTGDFRDVVAEGFAFDALTATGTISSGMLATDDFVMKGVNALARAKGSVNITAETQNLEVVVVPQINADSAILYAAINPAIGLAAFVGQFILRKPLAAVNTKIYSVTGSWDKPQIKTLKAESLGPQPGARNEQ